MKRRMKPPKERDGVQTDRKCVAGGVGGGGGESEVWPIKSPWQQTGRRICWKMAQMDAGAQLSPPLSFRRENHTGWGGGGAGVNWNHELADVCNQPCV